MADVTLPIGGHSYRVSCRDGEEDRLRSLGALVHKRTENIKESIGENVGEARILLLAALLLADELDEMSQNSTGSPENDQLRALASRIEALGQRLAPDTGGA